MCACDSITRLKMYYVYTFESFVFTYARVIIFLHLANVRARVYHRACGNYVHSERWIIASVQFPRYSRSLRDVS